MLRLKLLGEFDLRDASGAPLALSSRKDAALLACLATTEGPVDRARLIEMLWGDRAEPQARKSLTQSLVVLRRALNAEGEAISARRDRRLRLDLRHVTVDVAEFAAAAASGDAEGAARLYGGPLLDGFRAPSQAFEDWLSIERRHVEDTACGVFAALAETRIEAADWAGAIEAARRATEIDDLGEHGHRLLMRALAGAGRRNDALQQFHRLAGLLRERLDVRPDAETAALYRAMKESEGPKLPAEARAPAPDAGEGISIATARPGLAVLPLRFTEDDREDLAVADGITDELIASLAAYRWFFVTSALQAAAFRDRAPDPRRLHAEFGVRYVLSGTLRRSGNRLAMRLDLSDPVSGQHIWSERQTCHPDEALEAHDRLARRIAVSIEPEILKAEEDIALRVPLEDFPRWSRLAKARRLAEQGGVRGLAEGVGLAAEVVRRHPDCAYAQATLGWTAWLKFVIAGRPVDGYARDGTLEALGLAACAAAVRLDPRLYLGHAAAGGWHSNGGRYELAEPSLRRSIDLNPSFPTSYNQLVGCLARAGRPREALDWIAPLELVSPNDVFRGYYRCVRALACFCMGDDEGALTAAEESLAAHEGWLQSQLLLIAAGMKAGDASKSEASARDLLLTRGPLTRKRLREVFPMRRDADFEAIAAPLAEAGVLTDGPEPTTGGPGAA